MTKIIALCLIAVLAISVLATTAMAKRNLPRIEAAQKLLFKNMLKNYFHPVVHGWGIGYDCDSDEALRVKFHVVDTKILARFRIMEIIGQVKSEDTDDWGTVRDRIQAVIDSEGIVVKKGRISIDNETFLLTNITTGDTLAADVRKIPDYSACKQQNISAEDCDAQAEKVGDISITKRAGTELPKEPKFWVGTLNFNGSVYKFLALAYPRE
jgi:hypothetical protein